ncbi:hypothetical protein LN650_19155 [Klebsiella pneumoniae subsp. pneumoniae]|nr:hypothetical protein [Klebsiella pneumoniae subsp. pneumoniae]
MEPAPRNMP